MSKFIWAWFNDDDTDWVLNNEIISSKENVIEAIKTSNIPINSQYMILEIVEEGKVIPNITKLY